MATVIALLFRCSARCYFPLFSTEKSPVFNDMSEAIKFLRRRDSDARVVAQGGARSADYASLIRLQRL
jgi:hypothetical protein